jgi:hypothetical protein
MSSIEYDPLTGLPKKKTPGQPTAQPFALFGGGSQYDGPGGGNPGMAQSYSPLSYGGAGAGAAASKTGGMPDYKSLIAAALGPMTAQFGADAAADLGTRNQQLIRSLGQFGEEFDLGAANAAFGEGFVGESGLASLLPQANELARQTTGAGMSFKARSEKAHKDAVRQIRNALAARGALQSGELGHQLQEAQGQFDTGQYDARQQVQDFMSAVNAGYAQAQRARALQLAEAQRAEAARQAQLNPSVAPSYGSASAGIPRFGEVTAPPQANVAVDPLASLRTAIGQSDQGTIATAEEQARRARRGIIGSPR